MFVEDRQISKGLVVFKLVRNVLIVCFCGKSFQEVFVGLLLVKFSVGTN